MLWPWVQARTLTVLTGSLMISWVIGQRKSVGIGRSVILQPSLSAMDVRNVSIS